MSALLLIGYGWGVAAIGFAAVGQKTMSGIFLGAMLVAIALHYAVEHLIERLTKLAKEPNPKGHTGGII